MTTQQILEKAVAAREKGLPVLAATNADFFDIFGEYLYNLFLSLFHFSAKKQLHQYQLHYFPETNAGKKILHPALVALLFYHLFLSQRIYSIILILRLQVFFSKFCNHHFFFFSYLSTF